MECRWCYFLLCCIFKFSNCNWTDSLKRGLAKKPPWKCMGINCIKCMGISLKRNSIYVWKKREANQCCRSVISFQITEDVVHCCEMGLWQEVNQVYLLHRLALQWRRERVSLYAGPALQGLDKLPCSEASTPLRHPALFTLPKQAEDSLRCSTFQKRQRTLLLVVRLKSDGSGSK